MLYNINNKLIFCYLFSVEHTTLNVVILVLNAVHHAMNLRQEKKAVMKFVLTQQIVSFSWL